MHRSGGPLRSRRAFHGVCAGPRFVASAHLVDQSGKKGSPLKNAVLPVKWDARDYGWITPVKSHGSVGACWAFAVNAVIETQLLKSGKGTWDLSEKNMVNLHGWDLEPSDGGDNVFAEGYLLRLASPVAETNDVYSKTIGGWTPSPQLNPPVHIQNVVWTPALDGTQSSVDETKQYLVAYGAIMMSP